MKSLIIEYKIQAKAEKIYPFIFDLEKFGAFHPYMVRVTKTGIDLYLIEESIRLFGFIPMKPVYTAQVTQQGTGILYTSQVKKGVDLKISFHFQENDNITLITETVEVAGNRLVANILTKVIKESHAMVFKSINTEAKK